MKVESKNESNSSKTNYFGTDRGVPLNRIIPAELKALLGKADKCTRTDLGYFINLVSSRITEARGGEASVDEKFMDQFCPGFKEEVTVYLRSAGYKVSTVESWDGDNYMLISWKHLLEDTNETGES